MTANKNSFSPIADPEKGLFRKDPNARSLSYFCKQLPVKVDQDLISDLKRISVQEGNVNVRLSLHPGPEALHHDMIVLQRIGTYVRPHCHEGKGEAFHMLEGRMGVICFDEDGSVRARCVLSEGELFRVAKGSIHTLVPLTDPIIYHENKPGPFRGQSDNLYVDWSPEESDAAGIASHLEKMMAVLEGIDE